MRRSWVITLDQAVIRSLIQRNSFSFSNSVQQSVSQSVSLSVCLSVCQASSQSFGQLEVRKLTMTIAQPYPIPCLGQTRVKLYTLFRTERRQTIACPAARPRIDQIGEYTPLPQEMQTAANRLRSNCILGSPIWKLRRGSMGSRS